MVFGTIGWGFKSLRAYSAFFAEFGVFPAIDVGFAFWLRVFACPAALTDIPLGCGKQISKTLAVCSGPLHLHLGRKIGENFKAWA